MASVCNVQLSPEGEVLRSYGSRPGDGTGQLNGPGHLALVGHVQLVVVAEYHSSRVMLHDAQLRALRLLVDLAHRDRDAAAAGGPGTERPRRLCVVPQSGLLLVGLAGGGGVQVHRLHAQQQYALYSIHAPRLLAVCTAETSRNAVMGTFNYCS